MINNKLTNDYDVTYKNMSALVSKSSLESDSTSEIWKPTSKLAMFL